MRIRGSEDQRKDKNQDGGCDRPLKGGGFDVLQRWIIANPGRVSLMPPLLGRYHLRDTKPCLIIARPIKCRNEKAGGVQIVILK